MEDIRPIIKESLGEWINTNGAEYPKLTTKGQRLKGKLLPIPLSSLSKLF